MFKGQMARCQYLLALIVAAMVVTSCNCNPQTIVPERIVHVVQAQGPSCAPRAGLDSLGGAFAGQGLGGFSSASTVASSAGPILDWRPGKTLIVGLRAAAAVPSGLASVLGSWDTTGFNGWSLELSPAGDPRCTNPAGNCVWAIAGAGYELMTSASLDQGFHALCLRWGAADDMIELTMDGRPLGLVGWLPSPGTLSPTWAAYLGTPPAYIAPYSRHPFPGQVLWAELWASEATTAQCQAATYTAGNRYVPGPSAMSGAVVDFQAARDFATPSFTTSGTAPVTFDVGGSPSLVNFAEVRYTWQQIEPYFYDGDAFAEARVDANAAWVTHAPYTRLGVRSDAGTVAVEAISLEAWPTKSQLGAFVNGAYAGQSTFQAATYTPGATPPIAALPATATWATAEGVGNVFDVWSGGCDTNDYIWQPYEPTYGGRWCTSPLAVRVPTLLADGVTPAVAALVPRPRPPAHRVVVVGEAAVDWNASQPSTTSVIGLMRAAFPYPSDGITFLGGASFGMGELFARAGLSNAAPPNPGDGPPQGIQNSVTAIVSSLDGTSTNAVWISLMRADCFGPYGETPSDFAAEYGAMIGAVCGARPGTTFFLQGALQDPNGESCAGAYSAGYSYSDYRNAAQCVAANACPSGCSCQYVECGAGACVPDDLFDAAEQGGVFLTDAGLSTYEGVIASTLSGAGML